jgi:UDP:flavonoid glycosyltransferase YjiC (YdhE family)
VQPVLALALAIQARGHEALLAGPPEKAGWASEYGCPFRSLGEDLTAFTDRMLKAHTLSSAFRFISFVYREVGAQFDRLPEIIKGADLVVGASLVFALSSVAERLGIPYRYLAFCPQVLPSGWHPFPAFKTQNFPTWINRLTWQGMRILDRVGLSRLINNKRKKAGLKALSDPWLHFLGPEVIVASDREISELPPDLSIPAIQTGYMHLRQPRPSHPALERFLEKGPAPIFAGFGSMPPLDQRRNVPMMVEAARNCGQRLIINNFWEEPSSASMEKGVFFIKGYPHLDLFPRTRLVIHHGGAGTTAASAYSAIPQIIIPHILDQYYWGEKVFGRGLGPRPVRRSRLSVKKLFRAMGESLGDRSIREKAEKISREIRKRDSLDLTVKALSL